MRLTCHLPPLAALNAAQTPGTYIRPSRSTLNCRLLGFRTPAPTVSGTHHFTSGAQYDKTLGNAARAARVPQLARSDRRRPPGTEMSPKSKKYEVGNLSPLLNRSSPGSGGGFWLWWSLQRALMSLVREPKFTICNLLTPQARYKMVQAWYKHGTRWS